MTTRQFFRYCRESVGTRWKRSEGPNGELRLVLPDSYTTEGGRIFFHPMFAVAHDVAGFCPRGISSSNIRLAAGVLRMSPEIAELVFMAANTELSLDSHPNVFEIRGELNEHIASVERLSAHTFWTALKDRD